MHLQDRGDNFDPLTLKCDDLGCVIFLLGKIQNTQTKEGKGKKKVHMSNGSNSLRMHFRVNKFLNHFI